MVQHFVSFIILIAVMHDIYFDLTDSWNSFSKAYGLNQLHDMGELHCDIYFSEIFLLQVSVHYFD